MLQDSNLFLLISSQMLTNELNACMLHPIGQATSRLRAGFANVKHDALGG